MSRTVTERPAAGADRPAAGMPEIERAMRDLAAISADLLQSQAELTRRAERVERELESKVAELDGVTRHLEAILEALPTGVLVRDPSGTIVRVNRAALAILGVEREALLGAQRHPGLLAPRQSEDTRDYRRPDGSRRRLHLRRSPVVAKRTGRTGRGRAGSVEILDDRTQVEALAERLHQMDKMAGLGTLAAGIAHEIRNPLSAVKGFAALLLRDLPAEGPAARWARSILQGASEADGIITSLLSFSTPEKLQQERIDGERLLADAAAAVRTQSEGGNRCSIELRAVAPPFRGDRIKLRQALRNLIENAVQAQPEGGRVRAELERDGEEIAIRVADAGPGIPAELRARVLEPFFTTRAAGTGLGLPLVHTIARLHGGRLEVADGPGPLGGAEIRLRFPFLPAD